MSHRHGLMSLNSPIKNTPLKLLHCSESTSRPSAIADMEAARYSRLSRSVVGTTVSGSDALQAVGQGVRQTCYWPGPI